VQRISSSKKEKKEKFLKVKRKVKKVLLFLKPLKMWRKIQMLKRNLQMMKVIFPLKILKKQEINTEEGKPHRRMPDNIMEEIDRNNE